MTLALGIGANTAIFSGVYAYLWTPLPYPHPERLLWIEDTQRAQTSQQNSVSYRDARDVEGAEALDAVVVYRGGIMQLGSSGADYATNISATPELFEVLSAIPMMGRVFDATDTQSPVAVISENLWRRLASNSQILGQSLRLDGRDFTVIGVLPRSFDFLYQNVDVFLPLDEPALAREGRDERRFSSLGRLRPGWTLDQAQAQIAAISGRLERESLDTNRGWTIHATTLERHLIPRNSEVGAFTALAAVGLVLLIACANIANLLLGRGVLRRRELGIRVSLGASRWNIASLILLDSLVLAWLAPCRAWASLTWASRS